MISFGTDEGFLILPDSVGYSLNQVLFPAHTSDRDTSSHGWVGLPEARQKFGFVLNGFRINITVHESPFFDHLYCGPGSGSALR